jgi:hypothetical protein
MIGKQWLPSSEWFTCIIGRSDTRFTPNWLNTHTLTTSG